MSIFGEAVKEDTPEAYSRMYQEYAAMTYLDAFNLLKDAQGVLEAKYILGMEKGWLLYPELSNLITEAEKIADLAQSCQTALSVRERHRALTSSE